MKKRRKKNQKTEKKEKNQKSEKNEKNQKSEKQSKNRLMSPNEPQEQLSKPKKAMNP